MKKREENIYQNRINNNIKEIKNTRELRKKYKVARTSIAIAAVLTTSLGVVCYRKAPVDGALFYTSGYNDTEIKQSDTSFSVYDDLYRTDNDRYITSEGVHKTYITKGNTEAGTERVAVALPEVVSKTSSNTLRTQEIEVEPGVTCTVRTVPTSDDTLKAEGIASVGILAGLADILVFGRFIDDTYLAESNYRNKNRELKAKIKKLKQN